MDRSQNMEETLWNYIDGTMTAEQISFVERMLQTDASWKNKFAELMEVHQLMQDNANPEQPSLRFTQNVMEEISRLYITPAAANYINKNVIRGIGLFFLVSIGGMLIFLLRYTNWSNTGQSEELYSKLDLEGVNWNVLFSSTYINIFIIVNTIVALMLLDMYLTIRKKTGKKPV